MRKLNEAFSSYLQISFQYQNSGKFVSLSEELELVRAYLYVEKERHGNRLHVIWNVDQDIHLMLPPLTIQPLVENAVQHGIMQIAKGGTVHIRIERQELSTLIQVKDNGMGMSREKVQGCWMLRERTKGIGLYNTNRRLIQTYGSGLSIQSEAREGTSVSLSFPIRAIAFLRRVSRQILGHPPFSNTDGSDSPVLIPSAINPIQIAVNGTMLQSSVTIQLRYKTHHTLTSHCLDRRAGNRGVGGQHIHEFADTVHPRVCAVMIDHFSIPDHIIANNDRTRP